MNDYKKMGFEAFAIGERCSACWDMVLTYTKFASEDEEDAARQEFKKGFLAAIDARNKALAEEEKKLAAEKPHIGFRHNGRGDKCERYRFATLWEAAERAVYLEKAGDFFCLMFLPFGKETERRAIRVVEGEARIDTDTAAVRLPEPEIANKIAKGLGWGK